ncbi:hypothetical protein [Leptospira yasudae]|uniref:hypothetical protein n=1 Tax=Leptospira yasudae TaxID=2202201 RepID=UPI00109185A9|nr:hypothetical protein [Leptospira yasudae]TGN02467.1 hypothetical protein EHR10_00635 [Leptospira yasudae]
MNRFALILILFGFLPYCKESVPPSAIATPGDARERFRSYWESGTAEISSYNLSQVRYGENHTGKAILVFVTEDFSRTKQVKLDQPELAENDRTKVLKLNFVKNFVTGIYAYSMTLSVFTPLEAEKYPHSLKESMSSQEWCGNVFTQLNLDKDQFRIESYSYFETEGDTKFFLKTEILEDELWNRIRLDPESVPTGEVALIPGFFHVRLNHKELKPLKAVVTKQKLENDFIYTIWYPEEERTLKIRTDSSFPFKILAWEETFLDFNGHLMTTYAVLDASIQSDYWNRNKNEFRDLRKKLKLTEDSLF